MANPLYWQAPHTVCIGAHGLLCVTSFILFSMGFNGHPIVCFFGFGLGAMGASSHKEIFTKLQDLQRKDRTDLMENRYFQTKMLTIGSCVGSVLIIVADCVLSAFYIYWGIALGDWAPVYWGYLFAAVVAILAAITAAATIVGDLMMLREDRKHLQLLGSISLDEENGIDATRYQDEGDGTEDGIDTTRYRDEVDGAEEDLLSVADAV
ncbi:hypothetical protein GQ53DRAFT_747387 [Thozetella sp. PMI_491]|nr:hypothetical protein GQ53DRAFT_747387 [Thozetella sp. PMI_491]